jgi:succinate dehydrogenase hydrophobic anchor subunit
MSSKQLHDFIQVTNSMRKHHTKVEYFSKLILFIAIYLILDYKLIHTNNSMQGVIMDNFIQTTEYEMY